jgi:hypothetical protein
VLRYEPLLADSGERIILADRRQKGAAYRPDPRKGALFHISKGSLRARFLLAPHEEAARAGLSVEQCRALENVDRIGLELAARSFAHKRRLRGIATTRAGYRGRRSRRTRDQQLPAVPPIAPSGAFGSVLRDFRQQKGMSLQATERAVELTGDWPYSALTRFVLPFGSKFDQPAHSDVERNVEPWRHVAVHRGEMSASTLAACRSSLAVSPACPSFLSAPLRMPPITCGETWNS